MVVYVFRVRLFLLFSPCASETDIETLDGCQWRCHKGPKHCNFKSISLSVRAYTASEGPHYSHPPSSLYSSCSLEISQPPFFITKDTASQGTLLTTVRDEEACRVSSVCAAGHRRWWLPDSLSTWKEREKKGRRGIQDASGSISPPPPPPSSPSCSSSSSHQAPREEEWDGSEYLNESKKGRAGNDPERRRGEKKQIKREHVMEEV